MLQRGFVSAARTLLMTCVGVAIAFGSAAALPALEPLTVEAAIDTASMEELVWSPDGARLAVTVFGPPAKEATPRQIRLYEPATGELRPFTSPPGSAHRPRWSPDGKALAFLSDRDEHTQIYLLPTGGGEARRLTEGRRSISAFEWSPDGRTIAFLAPRAKSDEDDRRKRERDDERVVGADDPSPRLWLLDVASGELKERFGPSPRAMSIVWSLSGDRLFVSVTEDESAPKPVHRVVVLDPSGGEAREIATVAGPMSPLRLSPDGSWLSFLGCREGGPSPHDLFLLPVSGGTPRNLSSRPIDHAVEEYAWKRDGGLLVSAKYGFRSRLIDLTVEGVAKTRLSPELALATLAVSPRGEVALSGETALRPPELFTLDSSGELRRRSAIHERFASLDLAPVSWIRYPSFDGREIEAMVLSPPHAPEGAKLPTVLLVHGGPAWRFHDGFVALAQLLATSGHRVLMPNPRGSDGSGYAFMASVRDDWGGGDFRDLMAGVDLLVERGLADPDRLVITGWSYGGYMTAWAVTQTQRFRAAVAGAGLFDLMSEFGTEIQPSYDAWYFGLPWEKPERFLDRAPLTHVSKVRTPLLLLHPEKDLIDPLSQSEELYRALKQYGVRTELVVYPREGHTLRERAHIVDRHERTLRWLQEHLGTLPAAPR